MREPCVAVAYSGGRDSTALLHATLVNAVAAGIKVVAIHVHHGLSPHADEWVAHCTRECRRWMANGLPVHFTAVQLTGQPQPGDSVEAWARDERYAAIEALALDAGASLVLLGHHRRDQAETLLLQALRGAGVAGLSGMPRETRSGALGDELTWSRPWLDHSREAIEAYLDAHGLAYIDDDSNTDPRFARNRLRLSVWPALVQAFPQAEASLATAAKWAQEATSCLSDLAEIDLQEIADERGLRLELFAALSVERRSNALRYWLEEQTGVVAPASLVERLLRELPGKAPAGWAFAGGELRRYRGVLAFKADRGLTMQAAADDAPDEQTWSVHRAGIYKLAAWSGRFEVRRVKTGGIPLALLCDARLMSRRGNEQFQAGLGRPPRSLKKQFQMMAVPAWERDGPLVFEGGRLLFVPGLGIDARAEEESGEPRVSLTWHRDE
ncbi:MAG: tilS [Rhizobacter sp.]|nr:tilS [Rhizobacter sp.]